MENRCDGETATTKIPDGTKNHRPTDCTVIPPLGCTSHVLPSPEDRSLYPDRSSFPACTSPAVSLHSKRQHREYNGPRTQLAIRLGKWRPDSLTGPYWRSSFSPQMAIQRDAPTVELDAEVAPLSSLLNITADELRAAVQSRHAQGSRSRHLCHRFREPCSRIETEHGIVAPNFSPAETVQCRRSSARKSLLMSHRCRPVQDMTAISSLIHVAINRPYRVETFRPISCSLTQPSSTPCSRHSNPNTETALSISIAPHLFWRRSLRRTRVRTANSVNPAVSLRGTRSTDTAA